MVKCLVLKLWMTQASAVLFELLEILTGRKNFLQFLARLGCLVVGSSLLNLCSSATVPITMFPVSLGRILMLRVAMAVRSVEKYL